MRSHARNLAALVLVTPFAGAQDRIEPLRLLGQPRDAGVYHVLTGTWTRAQPQAELGPDVIYNASRPSGYFSAGWEGSEWVDEGILPGTSNPNFNGPQDAYRIDCFEFAYCSLDTSVDFTFNFYDSFQPCTPGACSNLAGSVVLSGFPAGTACWMVTIDLTGGNEICLEAEGGACNPGHQGANTNLDHFGWGFEFSTASGQPTGPILAGADPLWAPEGEGTCYLPTLTCASGPTANGAQDLITTQNPAGCLFGMYSSPNGCAGPIQGPFAQLHMVLLTDCTQTCSAPYSTYCDSGPNQLGSLSISTNALPQLPVLTTTGLTGGLFAYHLIGSGMGVVTDPPGSVGDLCLAGSSIGRYTADFGPVIGGSFSTDLINGNTGGGTGMLPNPPGGTLLPGSTWNFQTWTRVTGSSRFSDAISVQF